MKQGNFSHYQNDDDDPEDWDDNDPRTSFGNYRGEFCNNISFGAYRGGYGPMNSIGVRPQNSGGFGPRHFGGFGSMNVGGFRHMNSSNFDLPRLMGPPGNFGIGIRSLFGPCEPFAIGRGFGPRGPPKIRKSGETKALKYLLRCGVPKEYIRNVPSSILQLMEPEQCGVCALKFNSDPVARTHYLSKNHQKNLKKWLTQHKERGFQQPQEVPFKSRNLYCELCDVHITSKSHADSHYAGKTHRSIIEGRKLPRNPILLQSGMEYRLEQLIRREKRNIKTNDDSEEKSERVKAPKIVQSGLYCRICKTSVTCTEQMTTHLNGKKHLSKEKQHILKTMKGENVDKEEENEDAAEDDEDSGNEADQTEEADDVNNEDDFKGDDDYDWGNGSGTWDEPECQ